VKQTALIALFVSLFAVPAVAQDQKAWIDVNIGSAQSSQGSVATGLQTGMFSEIASFVSVYPKPTRGGDFDLGGGYMFTPRLGAGVSISGTAHKDHVGLGATIPHPVFFNAAAVASGATTDALQRKEGAVHMQLMVNATPASDRYRVRVFTGPSYFRLKQDAVSAIEYLQSASLLSTANNVEITGYNGGSIEGGAWGFHAGISGDYFFHRIVGVGGMVRYSRATLTAVDPLGANATDFTVGGAQVGGGLRLKF
jgi:hypothetical protein